MTLSPVFRSAAAVAVLRSDGVWDRLEAAAIAQRDAIRRVRADLPNVLDRRLIAAPDRRGDSGTVSLEFVQDFFFLIFFRSVLETIGVSRPALDCYAELNFCISGTVAAADNLFDDHDKLLLPLAAGSGARFRSILQLLLFQRLIERVIDRHRVLITGDDAAGLQRRLLSCMADIGALEGREEAGVADVLTVNEMVERVHRLRGGALFALGFVAPRLLEPAARQDAVRRAERAVSRLGTAFQMVDDLTDVAFDLKRGRQNLLVAQVHHAGTATERATLAALRESGRAPADAAATLFAESARAVLARAEREAYDSLLELHALGFWFPPERATSLVAAIVGLEGVGVMSALSR